MAVLDFVAEEKHFGVGSAFLFLSEFVVEHLAGGMVLDRALVSAGAAGIAGMKRQSNDGVTQVGRMGGNREERNTISAVEGIGSGFKDGDVVIPVNRDDHGLEKLRGGVGAVHEDGRLAAVAECLENMGGGDEVAVLVDEESVAEESVPITVSGGVTVQRIDDRAEGGGGSGLLSRPIVGHGGRRNVCGESCKSQKNEDAMEH